MGRREGSGLAVGEEGSELVEGLKNNEIDGQICTELRVQVEGSGTLPDSEALVQSNQ